jgi:hypothetical protein
MVVDAFLVQFRVKTTGCGLVDRYRRWIGKTTDLIRLARWIRIYPEDKSNIFLRACGIYAPNYLTLHPEGRYLTACCAQSHKLVGSRRIVSERSELVRRSTCWVN